MRNLLWEEYKEQLDGVAMKWGATSIPKGRANEAEWVCPLGTCRTKIVLRSADMIDEVDDFGSLSPRLSRVPRVETSGIDVGHGDAHIVRTRISSASATIDKALAAFSELNHYVVWRDQAPCDFCSGNGHSNGSRCNHCDSTGKRSIK